MRRSFRWRKGLRPPGRLKTTLIFIYLVWASVCVSACEQSQNAPNAREVIPVSDTVSNFSSADTLSFQQRLMQGPEILRKVVAQAERYNLQILLTEIEAPLSASPQFRQSAFHVRDEIYFNPASTVKLPTAIFAMERLDAIRKEGITEETVLSMDRKGSPCLISRQELYPGAEVPLNLKNLILSALVVSEDEAYNALFDWNGRAYMNQRLKTCGYLNARILQKFQAGCGPEQHQLTPEIQFKDPQGNLIYRINPQKDSTNWDWPEVNQTQVGIAWKASSGEILSARDFKGSNLLSLSDLHRMMTALFHPESVPDSHRFNLSRSSDRLLKSALRLKPSESGISRFKYKPYHESITCYFFCGQNPSVREPEELEVYNIVGQAYGFLTECAYVLDRKRDKAWILSATLYVNQNGVLNDGVYEYVQTGFPFMKALSEWLILSE
jgi:hypothetical protein